MSVKWFQVRTLDADSYQVGMVACGGAYVQVAAILPLLATVLSLLATILSRH